MGDKSRAVLQCIHTAAHAYSSSEIWWRFNTDTLPASHAFCEGNPPFISGFNWIWPWMQSFDEFFIIVLNQLWNEQSICRYAHDQIWGDFSINSVNMCFNCLRSHHLSSPSQVQSPTHQTEVTPIRLSKQTHQVASLTYTGHISTSIHPKVALMNAFIQ